MEHVEITHTIPAASRIGLGTWSIGGRKWGGTEEQDALQTIWTALDSGINLIDTAPIYGHGRAEQIVGKAIAEYGRRDEIVVATKAGLQWHEDGAVVRNSMRHRLLQELEDSLERLQVDYIDIYQIHWPDPLVPYQETAELLNDLHELGRIRAIGVSNFDTEQMEAFRQAAPLHVCQPPYNLFERGIETDVLPYCQENNVALLTYSALCRGMLSGRMTADREFEGDDLRKDIDPKFQAPYFEQYLSAVARLDEYAREALGRRVIHLALRWILDRGVDVALWGARHPKQLQPVEQAMGWALDVHDMQAIDEILDETIPEDIGPDFMAAPVREETASDKKF